MNEFEKVEASAIVEALEETTESINRNTTIRSDLNTNIIILIILVLIALALDQNNHNMKMKEIREVNKILKGLK